MGSRFLAALFSLAFLVPRPTASAGEACESFEFERECLELTLEILTPSPRECLELADGIKKACLADAQAAAQELGRTRVRPDQAAEELHRASRALEHSVEQVKRLDKLRYDYLKRITDPEGAQPDTGPRSKDTASDRNPEPRTKAPTRGTDRGVGGTGRPSTGAVVDSGGERRSPQETRDLERDIEPFIRDDAAAYKGLGESYLTGGSPSDAERTLSKALELQPDDPEALSLRASARQKAGNLSGALADADRALGFQPDNGLARAVRSYASEALSTGGSGRAPRLQAPAMVGAPKTLRATPSQRVLDPASRQPQVPPEGSSDHRPEPFGPLGSGPPRPRTETSKAAASVHAEKAAALNKAGDFRGALREASRALRLDPESVEALRERSEAHLGLKDHISAREDAEAVLRLRPRDALGHLRHARALEALTLYREALEAYRRAAELDPGMTRFYEQAVAEYGELVGWTDTSRRSFWPGPREAFSRWWRAIIGSLAVLASFGWALSRRRRIHEDEG